MSDSDIICTQKTGSGKFFDANKKIFTQSRLMMSRKEEKNQRS